MDETEKILRNVRAILNKLTPQKFTKLAEELIKLEINSQEDRLKGAIDILFEKSINEPAYSCTYAQLCQLLSTLKLTQPSTEGRSINFRSILLTRCQRAFDTNYYEEINYDELQKGKLYLYDASFLNSVYVYWNYYY